MFLFALNFQFFIINHLEMIDETFMDSNYCQTIVNIRNFIDALNHFCTLLVGLFLLYIVIYMNRATLSGPDFNILELSP